MSIFDKIKDVLTTDNGELADRAKDAADEARQKADQARKDADDAAKQADAAREKAGLPDPTPVPKAPAPKPAPKPAAKKPAPKKPKKVTYTVKPGDTLSGIGAKYGVDWHEIARVNKIPNPDLIFPGQEFVIPGKH